MYYSLDLVCNQVQSLFFLHPTHTKLVNRLRLCYQCDKLCSFTLIEPLNITLISHLYILPPSLAGPVPSRGDILGPQGRQLQREGGCAEGLQGPRLCLLFSHPRENLRHVRPNV